MKDDGMSELFDLDGIEEVLEATEKKDLEALKKAQKVSRAEFDEFQTQLRAYRESTSKRGQSTAKKAKHAPFKAKAYPKYLPTFVPGFTREQFTSLLPLGVVGRDESFHGRWRIYWKDPPKRRSASWDLYGFEASIRMLLKEARTEYCQLHGVECPIPGIL